jgi:2-desacetyl-2-hydroxyethyl bacteriochlorophyllide A dehydrogenase
MRAAVIRGAGNINVEEWPEPEPGPDEVKVKIAYCGVCGTDPEILEGRFGPINTKDSDEPRIIGHEASGTIVAVGENVKNYKLGQRVACDFRSPCGKCYYCRNKMVHFCRNSHHATGAYAEYAVYKEQAVYVLPDDISMEIGALLEPVSVAVHAVDVANIRPGGSVAISGAGTIGLLCMEMALKSGAARVLVSEPVAVKRQVAKKLGADVVVDPMKDDVVEAGKKLTDGRGFDTVIEASGNLGAAKQALAMIDNCGTILWGAVYPRDKEVGVPPSYMYSKELTIRAIFTSPYSFPRALNLLPKLELEPLITHIIPLDDIKKVFETHKTGQSIKILVKP